MDLSNEIDLEKIKRSLAEMNIPYKEGKIPENLENLTKQYGYTIIPVLADLSGVETVDAELGVIVRNNNLEIDNGVYIFTVLHSGKAGFIVVEPGTVSRAPIIRKAAGDLINAVTSVDLPPLTPFDMIEITAHMLAGTFMKSIMEPCHVPKEYEQAFMRLYMPKFLANVGMYFVGAVKEDGSPMVYEEVANIEPVMVWSSIQKGISDHENNTAETGKAEEIKESGESGKAEEIKESGKTAEKEAPVS